jgi:hypothetical protein
METKELTVTTPAGLISQAIEKGLGVAELKELMDLQERWEANQARKAFFEAFTKFQASAPDIRKNKKVDVDLKTGGKMAYNYAPLADICRQLNKPLEQAQISYRWEIKDDGATIQVTCLVSHVLGHTERTSMTASPDATGAKNAIQARGSAIEYLKRYTLIGALGLSTTDSDIDGQQPNEYEYNVDDLHKKFMEVYNQVIQIDSSLTKFSPDNWLIERTGRNYVKAIGDIRKVLFELQQKQKK